MKISVVIPTYNPNLERLEATLEGLSRQSLAHDQWELLIVDNASHPPVDVHWCAARTGHPLRVVREPVSGLTHARLLGVKEALAEFIVFCDDDNVLRPNYLESALHLLNAHPDVGVAGGKCRPKYLTTPPAWFRDGLAPLGCRDLGNDPQSFTGGEYMARRQYPDCAPIGAGMIFRRSSIKAWMGTVGKTGISDRKRKNLSSAGDCDIVLHALDAGYTVAYWPNLVLEHLIPGSRLTSAYLAAVSRAAYRDFVRVLDLHDIRPWPAISGVSFPFRATRAWFRCQAWRSPLEKIRWYSALGQFEGRLSLKSHP